MDTFRMITEVERRLKDHKDKRVALMIAGRIDPIVVEIVETKSAYGYVEARTVPVHKNKKPKYILIALDSIQAVNMANWQPE